MYTYHHVIRRLTEADKIRLLTDLYSLSSPELQERGIPQVNCATLREGLCGDTSAELPSPAALARSWNGELMTEAAGEATRRLTARGINHILLPPAGSAIVSDGERLSEDPLLSGALSGALLAGVNQAGLTATAAGYGFTPADSGAMDTPATRRFTAEHMEYPYHALTRRGSLLGLILETSAPTPEAFNKEGRFLLRRRANDRETVTALTRGELVIQGSAQGLVSALHTYRRLKTAITHGKATMGELETAILEGEAMSEETLDAALDRLLLFAAAVREGATLKTPPPAPAPAADISHEEAPAPEIADTKDSAPTFPTNEQDPGENQDESPTERENAVENHTDTPTDAADASEGPTESPVSPAEEPPVTPSFDTASDTPPAAPAPDCLSARALDGATVLLENRDRLLPLQKPTRICVLGDLARENGDVLSLIEAINRRGHTYVGYARGYDPATPRNDALTAEAVALAAESDVMLIFVGTESGKSRLPAAQLALLDEVSRLTAGTGGKTEKKTVVILSSEVAPDMGFIRTAAKPMAGLLLTPLGVKGAALHAVETVLGDRAPMGHLTETLTDPAHPAADRRGYKIGPFVGYRYYDTVGSGAVYPFGHGLSYTKFRYSALKVSPDGSVTFTVQNVGNREGTAIPQVYLGMRDSAVLRPKKELVGWATVTLMPKEARTVTLSWGDLLFLSEGIREKGTYRLSVGESVSDIRLSADVPAGEDAVLPDNAKLHEYLPTATNIHTERYVMEAEYTPMKPSLRNLLFGIGALVLALSVKIYDIVSVSNSVFLNIVAALLAVGAVFFFVLEFLDRKKQFARERVELEEANAALFAEAADIPVPSSDALFELAARDTDESQDGEQTDTRAEAVDHFLDADPALTFPAAIEDLTKLAAENGLIPDGRTVRDLLAAMASTRLTVIKGLSSERFASLVSLLGEYFGCPGFVDAVDETYTDEASLLYGKNGEGETVPRKALDAIESARRDPRTIHIVALDSVSFDTVSNYFVSYARYARAPLSACAVTAHDTEGNEVAYLLPENLWFVLNLREGEGLHRMPDYLTEVAAVLTPFFESAEPAATHTEFAAFRYGQMLYLCDRLKAFFSMEEDSWKRIDRLETYAARLGGFAVTNKLWLGLESYLAVVLTVEPDPAAALDEALAARLMPALMPALSGKIPKEERGLSETLDAVFGDGNTTLCRKTVKESGADLT